MGKVRVNMYLPEDLKDWFSNQAENNGFSLTTMVQVAMLDYKKQAEALDVTSQFQSLVAMVEKQQKVSNDYESV